MRPMKIGLMAKIEDENIFVSQIDVLIDCTTLGMEEIQVLHTDVLTKLYNDVADLTDSEAKKLKIEHAKTDNKKTNRTQTKMIDLIASLMNRGHLDAQNYRIDFANAVIKDMFDA